MRKIQYRPYLLLGLFFLFLFSLGKEVHVRSRKVAIASIAPMWKFFSGTPEKTTVQTTEDLFLKAQMESMREWLLFEERLASDVERLEKLSVKKEVRSDLKEFFRLRAQSLISLIEESATSILAPVVFREPASWSSFLWIGVGEKENAFLKRQVVAKNSPVVVGHALVGIVEEVGYSKSKVRLITDAHLHPAVRVVRGEPENRFLIEHVEALLLSLEGRPDLQTLFKEQKEGLLRLSEHLKKEAGSSFLAKGELKGTSAPLWRSRGKVLQGLGFNYDFPDRFSKEGNVEKVSLLKKGDLLITSGLDGIFPEGLYVGVVSLVDPLQEGASSYQLQAILASGSLEEIRHVFVLPPSR